MAYVSLCPLYSPYFIFIFVSFSVCFNDRLGISTGDLLEVIAECAMPKLSSMPLRDLANLTWAYAAQRLLDEELMLGIARQVRCCRLSCYIISSVCFSRRDLVHCCISISSIIISQWLLLRGWGSAEGRIQRPEPPPLPRCCRDFSPQIHTAGNFPALSSALFIYFCHA